MDVHAAHRLEALKPLSKHAELTPANGETATRNATERAVTARYEAGLPPGRTASIAAEIFPGPQQSRHIVGHLSRGAARVADREEAARQAVGAFGVDVPYGRPCNYGAKAVENG